ncbi:N-acetylneuraminate synthase family protein [Asinibacterium sp. OR53]|uniref:N-acetylneuraminate synthase family protein n=1 Tax=Asinibacterium sp. OR53 TaxID=925409 RepID=UPI0004AD060F|nr:N-acetylneuraminate synthase family protein [Asinibacterium sp. OR53]
MKTIKDFGINCQNKTFIIAEIGINHNGSLDLAKEMIDSAYKAGVDAVKFQTYITENRVEKSSPIFDILKKCELPFDAFQELKTYSENKGLIFFSTPFDAESVDYLESIGVELYKIASFDVVNNFLLKKIAKTGKPVILSVGMSNIDEIRSALKILNEHTSKVALLHCISAYPTNEKDANLAAIFSLKDHFESCVIGQSDHTNDIKVPLFAVAAGAKILEKHYKITDDMECVDAPVSISENQMHNLVLETRTLEKILGNGIPGLTNAQKGTEQYRRFKS